MTGQAKLICDSGAFSAWKLNKSVELEPYCNFLIENQEYIDHYVALDVIIPTDPAEAAKQSFENLLYMRKRGLDPIPVFHISEPFEWLDKILDLGIPYIGLSATSIAARVDVDRWYDMAWERLVDSSGNPIVKIHAFGDGTEKAMLRYPWKSADTSSWLTGQQHGRVFLPDGKQLAHRQNRTFSRTSPDIDMLEGEDAARFDEITKLIGLDKSALIERQGKRSFAARTHFAGMYYKELESRVNMARPIRYKPARQGLIVNQEVKVSNKPGFEIDEFDLYLVIGPNSLLLPALYSINHRKMLISYFYCNEGKARIWKSVKDFCRDPMECFVKYLPYAQYVAILREIIRDAKF